MGGGMSAVALARREPAVLLPATAPRPFGSERLLVISPLAARVSDRSIAALPELFEAGDVLVVNDAATLPASLRVADHDAELRLLGRAGERQFFVVALGAGDHHTATERRGEPPSFELGARLDLGGLSAEIVAVLGRRRYRIRFDVGGAELIQALYRAGSVIQYAHVAPELELWDVQNRFASRPWAVEMPSAGRPLSWDAITALRRRGAEVVGLTHAAGLSSSGLAELDRLLPLPEASEIPVETVRAIERARAGGHRVVAVGTSVVRALEDSARERGGLRAGKRDARLVIGPGFRARVVSALLTGLHEPGTSHFALMRAFAAESLLCRALELAAARGYLQHEFGDACLIDGGGAGRVGLG